MLKFEQDFGEISCFESFLRRPCLSVARITDPVDLEACFLHCTNQRREFGLNIFVSQTRNQSHLASLIQRVQFLDQLNQFDWRHRRPNLDANWIDDTSEVLYVCPVKLARAIANPQEMGTRIVVRLRIIFLPYSLSLVARGFVLFQVVVFGLVAFLFCFEFPLLLLVLFLLLSLLTNRRVYAGQRFLVVKHQPFVTGEEFNSVC
mmetsp:Transcript_521/g.967  ORF Transcript_521/g.967 Transcript_521/m.967 type:complete len:204 (-) Transcript_521:694-1305(-)